MTHEDVVADFRLRQEAIERSEKALEQDLQDYFFPLIRGRLDSGDMDGADNLAADMPDSVSKVFARAMIRQRQK